jgi:homoserine dehydrogenase
MSLDPAGGFMPKHKTIPIIFLGFGTVGQALLRQILDNREVLIRRAGLGLVPIGLADISGVLIEEEGISEDRLQSALKIVADGQQLDALPGIRPLDEVNGVLKSGAILLDLTASAETGITIRASLAGGCGVVLANKIPMSGTWAEAETLFQHRLLRYEVTVGAGLPVITTLRYLLDTGDRITGIEGCLSGTLGYLCDQLMQEVLFSDALTSARSLGYSEPDPRIDLSGQDVARKMLILARTAGWPLEIVDLSVKALYPESMLGLSIDEFMSSSQNLDNEYAERAQLAESEEGVLRYVARVGPEGGDVSLTSVPKDSALGALGGPENYIAIYSERYSEVPLVLSGPGAGPEVTAAGVLGDIISLSKQLAVDEV